MAKAYKKDCPCKICTIRTITCHAICKEYASWRKSGIETSSYFYLEHVKFTKKDFIQRQKKRLGV
jgi:hypothetical protein